MATENTESERCPVCDEPYNHVVKNGYRNRWPGDVWFEVCTPKTNDWMYVHTRERDTGSERSSNASNSEVDG